MHPSSIHMVYSNWYRFIDRERKRDYYKRPIGLAYVTIRVDEWDQMWAGEKLAFSTALRTFTDDPRWVMQTLRARWRRMV